MSANSVYGLNNIYDLNHERIVEKLKSIKLIFTDIDGTMFAPGGRIFCNHAGQTSDELVRALDILKRLDIRVIFVTGRCRNQVSEHVRLMDLAGGISELGCVAQFGSHEPVHYLTGDIPFNNNSSSTPFDLIKDSGIINQLLEQFPQELEYVPSINAGREVTHVLRGCLTSLKRAQDFIDATCSLPLSLQHNGTTSFVQGTNLPFTTSQKVYHLLPKNASKRASVAWCMQHLALHPDECLAIGDSGADVEMGFETGLFCGLANAVSTPLEQSSYVQMLQTLNKDCAVTRGHTIDGWCEMAYALGKAQGIL